MKGTVFERFEAVAQVRGASLALEADGFRLSYKELLTEAGRLRAKLWHLGESRPGIVAILTEHRTTAVVSMLGTAGSGHAYVPIDPADPDARISGLLKQVKPIAMIADRPLRERAEALALPGCVVIDPSDREGVAEPAPLHALRADPDSLLYISFTSGSTGVPKGVCQTHRNLIFHASAYIDLLGIDKEDRMSWLFAQGASASNMDIYGALFSGACLCAHDIRDDSFANLARWLDQSAVTLLHTVPTVIRELAVAMSGHARLRHVRAVDLAGEMLLGEDVARLRGCVPAGCQIYNRLAATECSFISSFKVCDTAHRTALPVGKPPAGVEIRILLDDGDKEAPLGETGRIAVDSRYVCPGYLGPTGDPKTPLQDDPSAYGPRRLCLSRRTASDRNIQGGPPSATSTRSGQGSLPPGLHAACR
jgi:phthiocerol/phenolphthiocerol synthesis type-I polyketide synthase E